MLCNVVIPHLRQVEICIDHFLVVESRSKLFFCFSVQTKPAKVRDTSDHKKSVRKFSVSNENARELLAYSSISPTELSTTSL